MIMTKKKLTSYLLILFTALQCTMLYGQRKWKPDLEYNHPKSANFVNETFVKDIGIAVDMKYVPNDSIIKENLEMPLVINGWEYYAKTTLHRNKYIEFLTLDEIRKLYCPEVKEPIIYMVNEHIIMVDAISYKIDKEQIESCEALPSSDFEIFKDKSLFTIVHIFTKDIDKPIRLGY